ncbi:sirohydrochlorin chelatase [Bacillus benzoevorans]|uniref:Sirohydrochlorin ferrochelatase n=1 Tax=Bacillus benzoevorans TaxID=1456 RepID=A0A7X0HT12_9BACI|nr:sirohydrochlorin chelatase [Bacillus benzoevorans]MBB6446318.1 sirohydrochlorin ferrochelatase [Bacillus benzoevorans]
MEAILYVCHGSRSREGCEQAVSFIKKCMENNMAEIQEYGFLELASPTIEEAFELCISRGASHIKVIPLLLLTAGHAKKDIPELLSKINEKYPDVTFQYGRPIGVDTKMIDIISERLYEKNKQISDSACILLVGRGSSDPDVKRDLSQIAEMLQQRMGSVTVKDCYLHGAGLKFTAALNDAAQSDFDEIYIVPYLLFTGRLMVSMKKTIDVMSKTSAKKMILCSCLGYHPNIEHILKERVLEL